MWCFSGDSWKIKTGEDNGNRAVTSPRDNFVKTALFSLNCVAHQRNATCLPSTLGASRIILFNLLLNSLPLLRPWSEFKSKEIAASAAKYSRLNEKLPRQRRRYLFDKNIFVNIFVIGDITSIANGIWTQKLLLQARSFYTALVVLIATVRQSQTLWRSCIFGSR